MKWFGLAAIAAAIVSLGVGSAFSAQTSPRRTAPPRTAPPRTAPPRLRPPDFAVQTSPQRGRVSLSPAYPDDALGGRKVGPWAARTETNLAGGGTASDIVYRDVGETPRAIGGRGIPSSPESALSWRRRMDGGNGADVRGEVQE
jgi:hypothetical protein